MNNSANMNLKSYTFVARTANREDVYVEDDFGDTLFATKYQDLYTLVRFLNHHPHAVRLYFCKLQCVDNLTFTGHYHVLFKAYNWRDAQKKLKRYLPDYNCESIPNMHKMNRALRDTCYVGGKNLKDKHHEEDDDAENYEYLDGKEDDEEN